MALTLATPNTLLGALQPKSDAVRLATSLFIVVLGSILLALSAKVQVLFPIPFTLQSMAVAGLAAAFGARIGVATVALYILEGIAGIPVFAGAAAGPLYIMGPTGGFILGWLLMALVIGYAADKGASKSFPKLFGWMIVGDAISFILGFVWLVALSANVAWLDQSNVVASAFQKAVQPFIVWDLLKMAFAALTIVGGWQLLKSRKG